MSAVIILSIITITLIFLFISIPFSFNGRTGLAVLLVFWPIGIPVFVLMIFIFLFRIVKTLFIEAFLKDGNE